MEEAFKINTNKKNKKLRNDTAVQGTNDSSILSKVSMAELGYFDDQFLKNFACKSVRRSPIINRGYYIRSKSIDYVIRTFLNQNSTNKNQIINLGAGFDSTFFRLKDKLNLLDNTLFIDIDFTDVIQRKISLIKSNQQLINLCSDLCETDSLNNNIIYRSLKYKYILIGIDMRDTRLLEAILKSIDDFNDSTPTLLMSEVVLTYMAVNSCNNLIKWIPETFLNCMIVIYEQVLPNDAFGQVMCAHFKKLGSPLKCIHRYPTRNCQINRYKEMGFTDCKALRLIDFYKGIIDDDERRRIDEIELFDEYEQWHLKCIHYIILVAAKGSSLVAQLSTLIDDRYDHDLRMERVLTSQIKSNNLIGITIFPLTFGIRFGHSLCSNSSNDLVYIIGGFGESLSELGRHKRINVIEILNLKTMSVQNSKAFESDIADRLFGTSCMLDDTDILLMYGRGSPNKEFGLVSLQEDSVDESDKCLKFLVKKFQILTDEAQMPKLRWRHSTCKLNNNEILLIGGKSFNIETNQIETLNDCFILSQKQCKKITINDTLFTPRCSHSVCMWKNYVVISGGLDRNENIIEDILLLDIKTFEIKRLEIENGYYLPRYAHTSHVIEDKLVLIGGVNFLSQVPGLCIIDLNKLKAIEFELPINSCDGTPLMLQNHQTFLLNRDNILIIGGGGNLFSFGTHINKKPIVFDIKNCWSLL